MVLASALPPSLDCDGSPDAFVPADPCPVDHVHERLKAALGGRSWRKVATMAGIGLNTMRGLLRGSRKRGAYADTLWRLARVLEVDAGWLTYGTGEPKAA